MADDILDTTWGFRMMPALAAQRRQLDEQKRYRMAIERQRDMEMGLREREIGMREQDRTDRIAREAADRAMALGQAEGTMGMSMDNVPEEVRNMPEFRVGVARGMADRAMQEERFGALENIQRMRGQSAADVAELRALLSGAGRQGSGKAAGEEGMVTVTSPMGDGKATYKLPWEEYNRLAQASELAKQNKPILNQIAGLEQAMAAIEGVGGERVSIRFLKDKPPEVEEGGIVFGRGVPKNEARADLMRRIGVLKSMMGGPAAGSIPMAQPPAGATNVPGTTNAPGAMVPEAMAPEGDGSLQDLLRQAPQRARTNIVQPRGTNVFNLMKAPGGGWKVY
jgi:hypothetical protein